MRFHDRAALEAAYRRTDYLVEDGEWRFVLHVDELSAHLAACHAACGVSCSAYVTAYNPDSIPTTPAVNSSAQAVLERELAAAGFTFFRGRGIDPDGGWDSEASVLVAGLDEARARALGRRYGQRAVLVAGQDATPRLVMLD